MNNTRLSPGPSRSSSNNGGGRRGATSSRFGGSGGSGRRASTRGAKKTKKPKKISSTSRSVSLGTVDSDEERHNHKRLQGRSSASSSFSSSSASSSSVAAADHETLEEAVQLQWRPNMHCRFCRFSERHGRENNAAERGYKVCHCHGELGYAHRVCFYRFLGGPRGRGSCKRCRSTWLVDANEVAPFLKRKSRVRIWRSVHFVASLALALLGLLAATILFAYLAKGLVYAVSGSPEFEIGHSGIPVRLEPSPGDLVTGGTTTLTLLLLYGLHRLLATCVPAYRRCCRPEADAEDVERVPMMMAPATPSGAMRRPGSRRYYHDDANEEEDDDDDSMVELEEIMSLDDGDEGTATATATTTISSSSILGGHRRVLPSDYELDQTARRLQQQQEKSNGGRLDSNSAAVPTPTSSSSSDDNDP